MNHLSMDGNNEMTEKLASKEAMEKKKIDKIIIMHEKK